MKQINIKLINDITPNMSKVITNSDIEVIKERTNAIIKNMIILLYLFNNLIIIAITSLKYKVLNDLIVVILLPNHQIH
ncbi:hypothetical protein AN1V17_47540 [Vallitalea sediminicola]